MLRRTNPFTPFIVLCIALLFTTGCNSSTSTVPKSNTSVVTPTSIPTPAGFKYTPYVEVKADAELCIRIEYVTQAGEVLQENTHVVWAWKLTNCVTTSPAVQLEAQAIYGDAIGLPAFKLPLIQPGQSALVGAPISVPSPTQQFFKLVYQILRPVVDSVSKKLIYVVVRDATLSLWFTSSSGGQQVTTPNNVTLVTPIPLPGTTPYCATTAVDTNYLDGTTVNKGKTIQKGWTSTNCGQADWQQFSALAVFGDPVDSRKIPVPALRSSHDTNLPPGYTNVAAITALITPSAVGDLLIVYFIVREIPLEGTTYYQLIGKSFWAYLTVVS